MFTITDFFNLLEFLQTGTYDTSLDQNLRTLATSEKSTSQQFFENTLDQNVFAQDDYKRLRKFLIDWYASFRTMLTTQKNISEIFSMPDSHLSELLKSFGYTVGLDIVPFQNKALFFLDLVNFYKKKGTIETIVDVLDYYGFSDADLTEYWLEQDAGGNLIFRPQLVRRSSTGAGVLLQGNLAYDVLTSTDPHWLYTESQIKALIATNKINLPSKTPYFSLASGFYLDDLSMSMALTRRIVEDQYVRWNASLEILKDVTLIGLGQVVSILETYLAVIYVLERKYGTWSSTNSDLSHYYYNGTIDYSASDPPVPMNLPDKIAEYTAYKTPYPRTRDDIKAYFAAVEANWTRLNSANFLNAGQNLAGPLLQSMNPDLYVLIEGYFATDQDDYLMTWLVNSLDTWIRSNVNTSSPNLAITMLGFGFRERIKQIVNFFKPFRARFAHFGGVHLIQDAVGIEDNDDDWRMYFDLTFVDQLYLDKLPDCRYYFDCPDTYFDQSFLIDMDEVIITPIQYVSSVVSNFPAEGAMFDSDTWTFDIPLGLDVFEAEISQSHEDEVDVTDSLGYIEMRHIGDMGSISLQDLFAETYIDIDPIKEDYFFYDPDDLEKFDSGWDFDYHFIRESVTITVI